MFAFNAKCNKNELRALVSVVLLLALLAPAPSTSVHAAPTYTDVGGPIISDTTWTLANSPYIVTSNVQVMTGVTLTIQAGVVVKFDSAKLLQVDGTLIARGIAANLITFTSNQPSPQKGDWGNIYFTDSSTDATFDGAGNYTGGSVLQYCIVEYGGNGVASTVHAPNAAPYIDHSTVRNNAAGGIWATGTVTTPVVISNNAVSGNTSTATEFLANCSGIHANGGTVTGNTVSGNSVTGNNANGGGIYANGSTVTGNTVSGNSASSGGGIYVSSGTVTGNTASGNLATGGSDVYGGGIYVSSGTVTGNTVSGNSATGGGFVYGGGIYANGGTVTGNTVSGNSATGEVYPYGGGIYANGGTVTGNTVNGNTVTATIAFAYGGGIYVSGGTVTGNTVSGNTVIATEARAYGGGICANGGTVTGNTVSGNSATVSYNADAYGGGIYVSGGTVTGNTVNGNSAYSAGGIYATTSTVMSNTVTANRVSPTGQGSGIYFDGSSPGSILTNTIAGNTTVSPTTAIIGGLAINGTPQTHYNNLYSNSNYDVVVLSSSDISGTNNYWGTVASVDILAHVYDWYDDSGRGRFLYIPYLQDPSPDAPVPPPMNLRGNFTGNSATFSWDPIPSTTTGYGYKVYYDNDASGPPYNGTGATQGNSPIDVGNATSYSLTGLPSGNNYIAVTAYDTLGRESWYSNQINGLKADFNAWPTAGIKPLTVVFTNTSNAGYTQSLWDFGDTITSALQSPTHIYQTSGSYTVTLAINGPGGMGTLTRTNYITVYNPVHAAFIASPTSGVRPLEVSFTNQSSGDYTTTLWSFRDGVTSTLANPQHTYTTAGTYTVILTVSGPGGTNALTRASYITVYTPVQAGLTASATLGPRPFIVTFTNASTGDYTNSLWNFGDGTTSTLANPTHTYTAAGTFTITLTVSGPGGTNTFTRANYITTYEPVKSDFTASPTLGVPPLTVDFADSSSGPVATWEWAFGDGATSTLRYPTHTYVTGTYTVSLTVRLAGGSATLPGGTDTLSRPNYIRAWYAVYLPLILRNW